jgi:DNA-directed RNA polymerase subunit D
MFLVVIHHSSRMDISITKSSPCKLQFLASGLTSDLANALRRIMIGEVQTWAIEDVQFRENTSIFPTEYIAHRLGLLPLKSDQKPTVDKVTFELSVQGADSEELQHNITTIYSQDLKANDCNVVSAIDKIPIVKLAAGQRLVLTGIAKQGSGNEHAKWSPVCTCTFKFLTDTTDHSPKCLYTIETFGSLSPLEVLQEAIVIFKNKFRDLKQDQN